MNVTLMIALLAAHTTTGVGTQYTEAEHLGKPLACDRRDGLVYDRSTGPWVAMRLDKRTRCWDHVTVYPEGYPPFDAVVLDTGDLDSRTFRGGQKVAVDVPEYWATWTQPVPRVRVVDWDAMARECVERGWCD